MTTRGLAPLLSPIPLAAAAASCSPAGRADRHPQAIDAEVSQLGANARPAVHSNEQQHLDWPITAVLASAFRDSLVSIGS